MTFPRPWPTWLAALALACASARAPAPSEQPAGPPSDPHAALGHAIALLEHQQVTRFFEEMILPEELESMKKDGTLAGNVKRLSDPDIARFAIENMRKAQATLPHRREDGALEFPSPIGLDPITLVKQQGRWYLATNRRVPEPPRTRALYLRIPAAMTPSERRRKYEEPLAEFVQVRALGKVTSAGTTNARSGKIEYGGYVIDVYDVDMAVPVLRAKLKELGVPKGTVIEELREGGPPLVHPIW
jgi:hypothetical protein